MPSIELTEKERSELHDHAQREMDGWNLHWRRGEDHERVRDAVQHVVGAGELLDAIGWGYDPDGPGLPRVDAAMLKPHAEGARADFQQRLEDDEAALPKGLEEMYRAHGQTAEQFRIEQEALIAQDRASASRLDALLERVETVTEAVSA